jgi:S1-C subfamily serine protease
VTSTARSAPALAALSRRSATPVTGTAAIAAKIEPAVVDINTTLDPLEGGGAAAGTGMIVAPDGTIVTNNHVVSGADSVKVTIAGHGVHDAVVVGTDPTLDVAVLRVPGVSGLPTVKFANSAGATVGSSVVAIGNALGLGGSPTVTTGIISALGRTITAADATGANTETLHGLLQTDAPISPGDSGGPLVGANATVLGMDTAAASAGSAGASLGFAIPSNTVVAVARAIERHENVPGLVFGRTAFLGVEVVDSSEYSSGTNPFTNPDPYGFGFGLGPVASTPNGTPGVVVAAVDPGSAAATVGIVSGDVITALDGSSTPTTTALSKAIDVHRPGQVVTVTVSTQSGTKVLRARLGEGPVD